MKFVPTIPRQPDEAAYGISALYLLPTVQSRDEWARLMGQDAAPWDPSRRPKYWCDDSKADLARQDPEATCLYTGAKIAGGAPRIITLAMPAWEAATVNIPPGDALASAPGTVDPRGRPMWEVPIRDLLPGETLDIIVPGVLRVVNLAKAEAQQMLEGKFLPVDRAVLRAIAVKNGIPI
jgi:hypothetical protein